MKMTLPGDRKIDLKIKHGLSTKGRKSQRTTEMCLDFLNGNVLCAAARCAVCDNFTKTKGRQQALNRLFSQDPGRLLLTSEDRQFLIRKLCPKLFQPRIPPKLARAAVKSLAELREMLRVQNLSGDIVKITEIVGRADSIISKIEGGRKS